VVKIRRVYDPPLKGEGKRYLVDGLWPRGIKKASLGLDAWLKEITPSAALRKWFSHDPEKWEEYKRGFRQELSEPEKVRKLEELAKEARSGDITLLFASRDREHNNAVVLKEIMEEKIQNE